MARTQRTTVRLKRNLPRMLFIPLMLLAAGAAAGAAGVLLVPGPIGLAAAAAGALVAVVGVFFAVYLLSIRLVIVPGGMRLATLGGR
ncbi:MAG TPA: hypothetical protein VG106_01405, partial [Vicinamibacterales bacterium]|nr:hypothetical protein [Vicinamibacterales bacterium]